jgi:hypothetical protein
MKTLIGIYRRLEGSGIEWVLTGSCAFWVQGFPVAPNDIDIQTDKRGAYVFEALYKGQVVQPVRFSESAATRSHFGEFSVDGTKVEVMGNIQKRVEGAWEVPVSIPDIKVFAPFDGMKIPVLPLDYEILAYRKMGRTEKADRLERWRQKKSTSTD